MVVDGVLPEPLEDDSTSTASKVTQPQPDAGKVRAAEKN
jgi:hypothetical protein